MTLAHKEFINPYIYKYCKSVNFRENFIFAYVFKRHIRDAKNSRLGHDLPVSVND